MKLYKSKKDNEVYYYHLKNGEKRWMYRHKYYDSLGKRKEKKKMGFETEKEALRSLLELKASLLNGNIRHVEQRNMTVSQWLDIWYETYSIDWAISTQSNIKDTINLHFKPFLGKYKLNSLTSSTYKREFINVLLDDDYSPNTVMLYHKYFMMAINAAVRDGILLSNNLKGVKIKTNSSAEENFLTPDELNIFLDAAKIFGNITQYTITLLLAFSGMRKGEALGLKWKDINFQKNTITIERTRDEKGVRPPKTKHSYRTIQIDPLVINQLKKYQKWCVETKLSYGLQLDKENDFIFISKNNIEEVNHLYVNYFFNKIYKKLEKNNITLKRITPHGLRHTHATILIDENVSPNDVASRLGNTIEMIYKVYAHKFKKVDNQSVILFGNRLKRVNN